MLLFLFFMMEPSLAKAILGSGYKEEKIHTHSIVPLGNATVEATFVFPPYDRSLRDLDHVGVSQMHEALVEGLYCAVGYALERGEITLPFDLQTFIQTKMQASLFMREQLSFRKLIKPGEEARLTLTVTAIQEKMHGKYISVTVSIQGFMRGEAECWLRKTEEDVPLA